MFVNGVNSVMGGDGSFWQHTVDANMKTEGD